jgi:ketosteroid isomerase-like protein
VQPAAAEAQNGAIFAANWRTPMDARREIGKQGWRRAGFTALAASLIIILAAPPAPLAAHPAAQNQKSNKNDKSKKDDNSESGLPGLPVSDGQAVDLAVSQMLGAWQIGDVEMMHKYYADDVAVVSGAYEPPLFGWDNYARAYLAQYARTRGGRLDRSNSYTKVMGDQAWVTYQWQFTGQVDGTPMTAFGHTTLLLEKKSGKWVIVLNHTSDVSSATQPVAAQASSPRPLTPEPAH